MIAGLTEGPMEHNFSGTARREEPARMVPRCTARLLRLLRLQPPLACRQLIRRPPQDSHAPILRLPPPPPHYPQPAQSSRTHPRQAGVTGIGCDGRHRRARITRTAAPTPVSSPGRRSPAHRSRLQSCLPDGIKTTPSKVTPKVASSGVGATARSATECK
jgi:hypothetical protein